MTDLALVFVGRLCATAVLIIIVTRVAQGAGPFLASTILTLPLFAGPSYFFLMSEVSGAFIAQSALVAFAGTGAVLLFTAGYILSVRRFGLALGLCCATVLWALLALPLQIFEITLTRAIVFCALGALVVRVLSVPLDLYKLPSTEKFVWTPLILRSLVAGVAVASVSAAGSFLGPQLTGVLVTFPITLSVSAWMVYRQYGAEFSAAVMSATQRTLPTYSSFCLALALLCDVVSPGTAFVCALLVSAASASALAWFGLRRRAQLMCERSA
jgi:hypothetical protein